MNLSPHLTLEEYLHTSHADLQDGVELLWNSSPDIRANAYRLAETVFEPVRQVLGCPLYVTSGLRTMELNARVQGRPLSRHMYGLAVDVVPLEIEPHPAIFVVLHAMTRGELPAIDQVIVEGRGRGQWLHLQAALDGMTARRMVLESEDGRIFAPVV